MSYLEYKSDERKKRKEKEKSTMNLVRKDEWMNFCEDMESLRYFLNDTEPSSMQYYKNQFKIREHYDNCKKEIKRKAKKHRKFENFNDEKHYKKVRMGGIDQCTQERNFLKMLNRTKVDSEEYQKNLREIDNWYKNECFAEKNQWRWCWG